MPNTHSTLTSLFSDIADAIRGKTGSSAAIVADNFPTAIASIPTGGGSATIEPLSVTANGTYTAPSGVDGYSPITVNVPSSGVTTIEEPNSTGITLYINSTGGGDVRFIDYDGTVLHTFSAEDFANLSAMPANPTHTGLTSQGWNWTLADAKTYVADYGMLDIGQMYVTDNGKTRVYINLADSARLSPYLGICPNGTVTVDWGDNTATDTLTGVSLTTLKTVQHTYASTGDYIITLEAASGSFAIYGSSAIGTYLLNRSMTGGSTYQQTAFQTAIKRVELGTNVSVGDNAFRFCFSLTNITIPSGVTSIGSNAFYYCYNLKSVVTPSGLTNISPNAFYYCSSLVNIVLSRGITSIDDSTFRYCASLANITIPSTVTSIGQYTFNACYSIKKITIPNGITTYGASAIQNCFSLNSITIPSGMTSIGASLFSGCHALSSITIPSSVTSIAASMFNDCNSLSSITIPNGVTSINGYAFYGCYSLLSITIPNAVTSIAANAFQNCYSIAEYHFLPTTPPTLANTNAFTGILSDCKIYVPAASLTAYQEATNWSTYASYMVGE